MPARTEPLLALVELLGRRHGWALVWELRSSPHPYPALTQAVGGAESVVSQRLRELRQAGLVEVDEGGDYRLTSHGRQVLDPLEQLADFAQRWSKLSARQRIPRGSAQRGAGET